MKAKLYVFHPSPFCAKARKILDYKGIDYELIEVDYVDRAELLRMTGQLMVPALALETGETIVDSNRIAMRLEELSPQPTIIPKGSRGLHQAMTAHFENELEDALFRAALPDELEYFRGRGELQLAFYRLIRE